MTSRSGSPSERRPLPPPEQLLRDAEVFCRDSWSEKRPTDWRTLLASLAAWGQAAELQKPSEQVTHTLGLAAAHVLRVSGFYGVRRAAAELLAQLVRPTDLPEVSEAIFDVLRREYGEATEVQNLVDIVMGVLQETDVRWDVFLSVPLRAYLSGARTDEGRGKDAPAGWEPWHGRKMLARLMPLAPAEVQAHIVAELRSAGLPHVDDVNTFSDVAAFYQDETFCDVIVDRAIEGRAFAPTLAQYLPGPLLDRLIQRAYGPGAEPRVLREIEMEGLVEILARRPDLRLDPRTIAVLCADARPAVRAAVIRNVGRWSGLGPLAYIPALSRRRQS